MSVRAATALTVLCVLVAGCGTIVCGDRSGGPVEGVPGSSSATPAITGAPALDLPASAVRTIATGLRIPWGLAFLPDGTALVTERGNAGVDRRGVPRIVSVTPSGTVTEVQRLSEVDLREGEAGCSASRSPPPTPPTGGCTSSARTACSTPASARRPSTARSPRTATRLAGRSCG